MAKFSEIKGDLYGSIGDLGSFLPYVAGAIALTDLGATGILFSFGLMYIVTGFFYRLPIPVQPMKVIGAAILVNGLTAGEIAWSGIIMGVTLIFLSLTGWIEKLARLTPASITIGIQAGLGISLALLGLQFVASDLLIGVSMLVVMFLLLGSEKIPASIVVLAGGTIMAFLLHPELSLSGIKLGLYFPHLVLPQWSEFIRGFTIGFLPQLPLTLPNSILVTAVLAQDLYGVRASRVNERNLCMTLGLGNLLTMPLGGYPLSHGSGGLTAHYRYGARTGLAPIIIGLMLMVIAITLGPSSTILLKVVPEAVLGSLLFFSGLDMVISARGIRTSKDKYIFAVVVVLSVAFNPGIGFLVGLPVAYLIYRELVKV